MPYESNTSIMLDLETLGTTADAVIMSIGAVRFHLGAGTVDRDDGFYASVSIDSNHHQGAMRRIEESTVCWWMGQSEAARRVFSESKVVLPQALADLADWIARVGGARPQIWSCGADFDIAMLRHAYETHTMTVPWHYTDTRCHRTLKNLPGAPARRAEPTHHALEDAISQAEHAVEIYRAVFGAPVRAMKAAAFA